MKNKKVNQMAVIAMIAAIYTVVTVVFGALSYGPIQIRIAEVLIITAVVSKEGIYGMTLGCFISNVIGLAMGMNELGAVDAVIGTTVTFIAAVLAYQLRDIRFKEIPYLSLFMPVILNALVIGLELVLILHGSFDLNVYFMHFGSVFIGQFISCIIAGALLFKPYEHLVKNNLNYKNEHES